jgi:hypothetical protein
MIPRKSWTPTLVAMYGYNAVLIAQGSFGVSAIKKTYFGFSAGLGFDFRVGNKNNKVSTTIFIPLRSQAFTDKYDYYRAIGYDVNPDILPFTLSIGIIVNG